MKRYLGIFFSAVFIVYFFTLAPSVAPQGDSGELVAVAKTLGIAHPTSYPLYIIIAHLFTLIPFGTVAWRVNLFSAITQTASLVVFFLIVFRLTKNKLIALLSSFVLAFSTTYWQYALVAEVFPLNNLFTLCLVLLALLPLSTKNLVIGSAILGLGLSHHQTLILIIPGLLLYLFNAKKIRHLPIKWYFLVPLIVIVTFVIPYVFIYLRIKYFYPQISWTYSSSLSSIINIILRRDYGTFAPTVGLDPALVTLTDKFSQIITLGRFLLDDFTPFGLVLALLGFIYGLIKYRRETIAYLVCFLVSGPLFISYANFPITTYNYLSLAILERFYLLPILFVGLFISFGIFFMFKIFSRIKIGQFIVFLVFSFYIITLITYHLPIVSQRDNHLAEELGRNILRGLPNNAIILPVGDIAVGAAFYAGYGENFNPKIYVLHPNILSYSPDGRQRYKKALGLNLDLAYPEVYSLASFIRANYLKYPIFTTDLSSSVSGLTPLRVGLNYHFYPDSEVPSFDTWKKLNTQILASYVLPTERQLLAPLTIGDRAALFPYIQMYYVLGKYCEENKDFQCSVDYYAKAVNIDPGQVVSLLYLANALAEVKDCPGAEKVYLSVLVQNPWSAPVYKSLVGLHDLCGLDSAKTTFYQNQYDYWNKLSEGSLKDL